ncbi:hypothetical protein D3C79_901030 [compost metagenome]
MRPGFHEGKDDSFDFVEGALEIVGSDGMDLIGNQNADAVIDIVRASQLYVEQLLNNTRFSYHDCSPF